VALKKVPTQVVENGKRVFREVRQVVGAKHEDKLAAVMNTMQIRRMKEDVLDLPPKTRTFPELELSGPHLEVYRAMKDYAMLMLSELDESKNLFSPEAQNALQAALRCEQIAQGFVGGVPDVVLEKISKHVRSRAKKIKGRHGELMFPDSPKVQWIMEGIQSVLLQGGQVVIVNRFNGPLAWLRYQYPDDSLMIHGGQDAEQRQRIIDEFAAGNVRILMLQVSIAVGFNLVCSQDMLFMGRDWSPAVNVQCEDRLYRIGQKGTVNIQVPVVTNTVEKRNHERLLGKAADAEAATKSMTVKEMMEAL
jgi:SNF2 family DNA or RNA helicase